VSDTFVPPEILAGSSMSSANGGNDYLNPLIDRPVDEVVQMVDKWFKRSVENRRHVENQTLLNLAFHLGQQYVRIDANSNTSRVVPVEKKRGQVRTVDNLIDPAVRQEKARLLRTRPIGEVIPQGNDPADHEASKAGSMAIEHSFREGGWEEALEEATEWAIIGGTGHIGVAWEAGLFDSFGQQGQVAYRSLSPFEFAVPHLRRPRIDDQPYVMVTKAYEVDEIEERWGKRVQPDREEQFGSFDERLRAVISGSGRERGSYGSSTGTGYNQRIPVAVVKEVWIRPSKMAPDGAVLIVSSGQLLQFSPKWPEWCNGQYPFGKVSYTDIPGAYWDKGLVNDLIPLQRRHNRAASVLVEMMGILSHTSLAVPRGTKVKQILSGRGTMYEVPPGVSTPAQQINPSNMGNLPIMELDQTRRSVNDLAFFHQVSKGQTPPNVRSGTAISALKELDDSAASIPIRSIERATQRMGRFALNLVKEKWDEGRMMMIFGTEGDIEMRSFVNAQGKGGQYWVQPGSAWPVTKGQRQQMVLDLYDRQLIGPEEALIHLEVGTPQSIKNDRYIDTRHARRENQKFDLLTPMDEQGQVTQESMQKMMGQAQNLLPAEWHNHQEHLKQHNKRRKSPTYERWEPWRKQLFEGHISGHRVALEQQIMAQIQGPAGPSREAAQAAEQQRAGQQDAAARASERIDVMRQQALQEAAAQAAQQQQAPAEGEG